MSAIRSHKHIFARKRRSKMIKDLIMVYGFRCWYCGYRFQSNSEVCIDHIQPISDNGTSDFDNLSLACKFCNSHKFYLSASSFLQYLARIRTGRFECLVLKRFEKELDPVTRDILSKSFYSDQERGV